MTDPKFHGFCLGIMFCACVLAFLFVCASVPPMVIGDFAHWGGFWMAVVATLGGAAFCFRTAWKS